MAICKTCGRLMPSALSCTQTTVTFPDGATFDRLPYIAEDGREQCPDCRVLAGGFHHSAPSGHGCDQEKCPRCGGQLLMCFLRGGCC